MNYLYYGYTAYLLCKYYYPIYITIYYANNIRKSFTEKNDEKSEKSDYTEYNEWILLEEKDQWIILEES